MKMVWSLLFKLKNLSLEWLKTSVFTQEIKKIQNLTTNLNITNY